MACRTRAGPGTNAKSPDTAEGREPLASSPIRLFTQRAGWKANDRCQSRSVNPFFVNETFNRQDDGGSQSADMSFPTSCGNCSAIAMKSHRQNSL